MAAETFSFQRISSACKQFSNVDSSLDIAAALRKPYRRRHRTFFDALEELVKSRNEFVHRAVLQPGLGGEVLRDTLLDLDIAMTRVQRTVMNTYGWPYAISHGLSVGGKSIRARDAVARVFWASSQFLRAPPPKVLRAAANLGDHLTTRWVCSNFNFPDVIVDDIAKDFFKVSPLDFQQAIVAPVIRIDKK
jgi:hypothetical protein